MFSSYHSVGIGLLSPPFRSRQRGSGVGPDAGADLPLGISEQNEGIARKTHMQEPLLSFPVSSVTDSPGKFIWSFFFILLE